MILTSTGPGPSTPGETLKSGQRKVLTRAWPGARMTHVGYILTLGGETQPTARRDSHPSTHQEPPPAPTLRHPHTWHPVPPTPPVSLPCQSRLATGSARGSLWRLEIFPAGGTALHGGRGRGRGPPPWGTSLRKGLPPDSALGRQALGGPDVRPEGQKWGWGLPMLPIPKSASLTGQEHGQMAEGSPAKQPGERARSHGCRQAGVQAVPGQATGLVCLLELSDADAASPPA